MTAVHFEPSGIARGSGRGSNIDLQYIPPGRWKEVLSISSRHTPVRYSEEGWQAQAKQVTYGSMR